MFINKRKIKAFVYKYDLGLWSFCLALLGVFLLVYSVIYAMQYSDLSINKNPEVVYRIYHQR